MVKITTVFFALFLNFIFENSTYSISQINLGLDGIEVELCISSYSPKRGTPVSQVPGNLGPA